MIRYDEHTRHRHRNLFCVECCTTCNISPVGLLLRKTRINKHFKTTSITACTYTRGVQYVM